MTDIKDLIRRKAIAAGMDPLHALTMASIESSFNPRADNGKYKGLYQFGPDEWKKYGGGKDVFDPEANIDAMVGYHGDIKNNLATTLGRDPSNDEMYLGWQQGAGGAGKILTTPDARAVDLVGKDAISANGGDFNMTGGQFGSLWKNKYKAHQKTFLGPSGWQGESDTQESPYIGAAPGANSPDPATGILAPRQATGMMAGVPGFNPDDPGAYANRTTNDADMGSYGGSPKLPDYNWGALGKMAGLGKAGIDMMGQQGTGQQQMGGNPVRDPGFQPMPQAHALAPARGSMGLLGALTPDRKKKNILLGGLLGGS